jgi:hypothetical protein
MKKKMGKKEDYYVISPVISVVIANEMSSTGGSAEAKNNLVISGEIASHPSGARNDRLNNCFQFL